MSKTDDGMHKIKCHAKKGYVKVVKWVEMKRERTRPLPRVKNAQFLGVGLWAQWTVALSLSPIALKKLQCALSESHFPSNLFLALSFHPSLIFIFILTLHFSC